MSETKEVFVAEVTKEQFEKYRYIQEMGAFNMLSPEAREMSSLDKIEWMHIIKNYSELMKHYKLD